MAKRAKASEQVAQNPKPKAKRRKAKAGIEETHADAGPDKPVGPDWDERFVGVAAALVRSGQGELSIAKALGCSVEDIRWWREEHPKFDEVFAKAGRPTEFSESMIAIARKLAELGATDMHIAQAFEVNVRTIYRWRLTHPEFDAALKIGKEQADELVEQSLFKRATGYTFDTEKVFMVDGEAVHVEVMEHVPPDVKAAVMWLLNRRGDKWRNPSHIKHDVDAGSPLGQWLGSLGAKPISPDATDQNAGAGAEPAHVGLQVKE